MRQKHTGTNAETAALHKVLPRIEAGPDTGLTGPEAGERLENGYGNVSPASPEKSVGRILKDHIFTYFNLIFVALALLVVLVESYRNLTFVPIIFVNTAIGIVQELRSKRKLARLRFLAAPHAAVVRDGEILTIPAGHAVRDDIAVFSAGNQVYADAVVLTGECRVNEALVTGESDEIVKTPGDGLLSGSFVVSGECRARLDKVGNDSFVSRLTLEAKKHEKKRRTGMTKALTRLLQVIGFLIIPFGAVLYLQQTRALGRPVADGVVSTVAALIGMIPEGLYLLVTVALTVSVIRLAQKKTLVHDMSCIETLARVDVLCVDKTGTITESKMTVADVIPLRPELYGGGDVAALLSDYARAMSPDNETMAALQEHFTVQAGRRAVSVLPFSPAVKYGGVAFDRGGVFLLGAPEKLLSDSYETYRAEIEAYSSQGCRVLLLARYGGQLPDKGLTADTEPVALVTLSNRIRPEAPKTFRFFKEQGVSVKVISGDNPLTVSRIALEAGIENADKYVDASALTTERKLSKAVRDFTVFGRVTPDQKRRLIRALKADGHTVAMTGDGVNDVLALKDADCSVAMASGSDVACQVSQIVLLDSNFSAMPAIVGEGRRVINNIERSSSLFLVKNIFSFLLTLTALIFALTYPITPSQLTLFNITVIGIPSFILALEPNTGIIRGRFLLNVFLRALPAGFTSFLALIGAIVACSYFRLPTEELTTMATVIIGIIGFMLLYRISRPLNSLRLALLAAMIALFAVGGFLFPGLFTLSPLSVTAVGITAAISALAVPVMLVLSLLTRRLEAFLSKPREKRGPP